MGESNERCHKSNINAFHFVSMQLNPTQIPTPRPPFWVASPLFYLDRLLAVECYRNDGLQRFDHFSLFSSFFSHSLSFFCFCFSEGRIFLFHIFLLCFFL